MIKLETLYHQKFPIRSYCKLSLKICESHNDIRSRSARFSIIQLALTLITTFIDTIKEGNK